MREMKDSGHAWLGMIPSHWSVVYPKALFQQRKDRAVEGDRQLTASQQYGVVYQDEYMETTALALLLSRKTLIFLSTWKPEISLLV
jgi:type I restriction enzyme S subunit